MTQLFLDPGSRVPVEKSGPTVVPPLGKLLRDLEVMAGGDEEKFERTAQGLGRDQDGRGLREGEEGLMLPKQEHPEKCSKGHALAGNVYWSRKASKGAPRCYCRPCATDRKRAQLDREQNVEAKPEA